MNLVITGGAGYIGSVVAEFAVAGGHHVTVIDNLQEGNPGAVPAGARLVIGDFGDRTVLEDAFGTKTPDAVIHLAAETTVATSVTDPAKYFLNNVSKGLVLLEAMRRHHAPRMVFSSTAATYGEPVSVPISEEHPTAPISAYGESKLMFERCLSWYHRAYGIRSIALRYFNAAGATVERGEDRRDETHLIPLVLSAAQGKRPSVDVFGTDYPTPDGSCVRDYVHVGDIARAHLAALSRIDSIGFDFFNVAGESGHTVLDIIRAAEAVTGRRIPHVVRSRRPGDPAILVASAAKLRRALGWAPEQSSLESIIGSAWSWRLRFPKGYERSAA
jgi:UDP-glucose 4-epimerase